MPNGEALRVTSDGNVDFRQADARWMYCGLSSGGLTAAGTEVDAFVTAGLVVFLTAREATSGT